MEELHLVNETWDFKPRYIQRTKLVKPLAYWSTYLFVCELSYALHVKYVKHDLSLSQICKGHLEETLWYFLTSTEQ